MTDAPQAAKTGVSPISGTRPPVEYQFKPGNPGGPGRPRGAMPRTAALRALARNPDADGIGAKAAALGERYVALLEELVNATPARSDLIRAELAEIRHTFSEAEGKPTEHVIQEATGERTVILRNPPPPQPLPEGD